MNIHNEISARLAIIAFNIQEANLENKPGYKDLEKVYDTLLTAFDLHRLADATYDNEGVMINVKPGVKSRIQEILESPNITEIFKETSISDLIEYNEWSLTHFADLPETGYSTVLRGKIRKNILALLSDGVTSLPIL